MNTVDDTDQAEDGIEDDDDDTGVDEGFVVTRVEREQEEQEERDELPDVDSDSDESSSSSDTSTEDDNSNENIWFTKIKLLVDQFCIVSLSFIFILGTLLSIDEMMIRFMGC